MESQQLSVIRVWSALAWADGVLARPEEAALRRLIEGAGLEPKERDAALRFLEGPVALDTSHLDGLSTEAREGAYRAAVRLAGIDRNVAPEERALLERLRAGLGLDEAFARRLEESERRT